MLCWISYPFCSSQNFDKKCGLFKQRNVASRCSAQGPSFKAAKITQHFEPAHIFHHPPKACGSSTVSGLPPLTTPIGGSKTDSGPQSGRFHRESPPSTLVQPLSKNFDHELKPGSIKAASAVDITSECDFKKKNISKTADSADSTYLYPSVSSFTKHSKSLTHPGFEASGRMTIPSLLTAHFS